jgi:hypothetical protein
MSSTTRQDLTWADLRRRPGDRRPPAALVVGAAMMLQLTWVGLGRDELSAVALTVGVVVSAALASLWLTLPAAVGEGLFAFLVVDGFVQGSYGTLTWDGARDLALLAGTVLVCLLVAEAAYDLRWSKPAPVGDAASTDELVPWWCDDDLVELSLGVAHISELPDVETAAPEPRAPTTDAPELHITRTEAR